MQIKYPDTKQTNRYASDDELNGFTELHMILVLIPQPDLYSVYR